MSARGIGRFAVPGPRLRDTSVGPVVVRDAGGPGTVVLLVHGWSADGLSNWLRAFEPLADAGYRPIAVDMPGHGGSPLRGRFSIGRCATALADVLSELDLRVPTVAVGYSMGGPVSQTLAFQRPDLVHGIVQIATAAHIIPSNVNRRVLGVVSHTASLAEAAGATLNFVSRFRSGGPSDGPEHDMGAHASWMLRSSSKRALLEAAGELARFDSRRWVAGVRAPAASVITLVDRAVPVASQRELANLIGAQVFAFPFGHVGCLRPGFGTITTEAVRSIAGPGTGVPTLERGALDRVLRPKTEGSVGRH